MRDGYKEHVPPSELKGRNSSTAYFYFFGPYFLSEEAQRLWSRFRRVTKISTSPKENTINRRTSTRARHDRPVELGHCSFPALRFAQQKSLKEQLVGSWIITSNNSVAPDGTKHQLFGPNPKGILVFDSTGHYVQIFANPDVPKFKINNRLKGTPERGGSTWNDRDVRHLVGRRGQQDRDCALSGRNVPEPGRGRRGNAPSACQAMN